MIDGVVGIVCTGKICKSSEYISLSVLVRCYWRSISLYNRIFFEGFMVFMEYIFTIFSRNVLSIA